jgi:lipopolysaccharide biosynthesis glycosyltransferase
MQNSPEFLSRLSVLGDAIQPISKDPKNIVAFFACDRQWVQYLGVALTSLAKNSSAHLTYDLLVLQTDFTNQDETLLAGCLGDCPHINLRIISLKECFSFHPDVNSLFPIKGHYTQATYYRLLAPLVFKNYDKMIYLDSDMIILHDIALLYEVDLGNNLAGACRGWGGILDYFYDVRKKQYFQDILNFSEEQVFDYFNSGMLVMNLHQMREEDTFNNFLKVLETIGKLRIMDQDILNYSLQGRIYYINSSWNNIRPYIDKLWNNIEWNHNISGAVGPADCLPPPLYEEFMSLWKLPPKILHFVGSKPWSSPDLDDAHYFWRYARSTSYYEALILGGGIRAKQQLDLERRRQQEALTKQMESEIKRRYESLATQMESELRRCQSIFLDALSGSKLFWGHQFYRLMALVSPKKSKETYIAKRRNYANRRKAVKQFFKK